MYVLEIAVAQSRRGIFLSKGKYILDLLTKTRISGYNTKLAADARELLEFPSRYAWLVSKLKYLTVHLRA